MMMNQNIFFAIKGYLNCLLSCFVHHGVVRRGCGTGDETGNCVFCNNVDGCNNRTLTHCYSCSSTVDRNCVDPSNSEGVSTRLCDTSCIETIVDENYIMRGCEDATFTCEGSNSSYCNTCDGELCNNAVKPLGVLDCYQCGGIENPCDEINEAIEPTKCKYFYPADRCIQYFSNLTMIRGCLSDAIGEECLDLGEVCLKCDDSGCNGLPLRKPPSISCIQCSASAECAWGFQNSAGMPCKNDILFWQTEQCYTRQYNETKVDRGCTLDDGCPNSCQICSSNNCNNENIIKQSCIQCNIKDDPLCTTVNAQDASECKAPIQRYEDRGCFVLNKVDGHTYRGCELDLDPEQYPLQFTCPSIEFCNDKIFPTDRLFCYKCEGSACSSPRGGRACVNYDPDDQCYTNVFTETNITRGCISDGNATETSYIVKCDTNFCNNRAPMRTLSCIKCSSDQNRDCVRDPEPTGENCTISVEDFCTVFPLLGRIDGCYVKQNGDLVERGCLSVDYGPEGPSEEEDNIEICETNICNRNCQPEVLCYTCDSSTDPKCADNLNELQPEVCEDYGLSTCYACMQDQVVTRGCGSSNLTDTCLSCDTNGCNNFTLKYCYNCSSADNPNCAQLTNVKALGNKICYTDCVARIDGENTVRGCVEDFEPCEPDDPKCRICEESLCNTEIVPANRLRCYHCDGTTPCLNLTSKNEVSLPCANYGENDMCMAYLSKNNLIRGCLSDKERNDCKEIGDKCLTCGTSNCNGVPLLRPSELSCISCIYVAECSWGFNQSSGRRCRGDVPFYANESCYTYQYDDGGLFSRGCTLEGGCDPTNNTNCQTCDDPNCNNANKVFQECIQCDSGKILECEKETNGSSATRCPGEIQIYEDRGCYVQRIDKTRVVRGCIAQLNYEERDKCKNEENKECELCFEQACNKKEAPNKSSYTQSSFVVLAVSILFVFHYSLKEE